MPAMSDFEQAYLDRKAREDEAPAEDRLMLLQRMGGLKLPGAHNRYYNEIANDQQTEMAKRKGELPSVDTDSGEPGLAARAAADIGEAFTGGDVVLGPLMSIAMAGMELQRVFGIKTAEEVAEAREGAETALPTTTGKVLMEGTKYGLGAVPGFMGGNAVATALKAGPIMTGLLQWAGTIGTDFMIGATMENPDDPISPAKVMLGLLDQAGSDSWTAAAMKPFFAYLAGDPNDSELEKRLLRGAQEAVTNVVGEAALLGARLPAIKRWFSSGKAKATADALEAYGKDYDRMAHAMAMANPEYMDRIYSDAVADVSPDLAAKKGARNLARKMREIDGTIETGVSTAIAAGALTGEAAAMMTEAETAAAQPEKPGGLTVQITEGGLDGSAQ